MDLYSPKKSQTLINSFESRIDNALDNNLAIHDKIQQLESMYEEIVLTDNGVNILLSKLLAKHDIDISHRRKGDVHNRTDATLRFPNNGLLGITEIEIPSSDILDTPRNILEGVAIQHSRFNIKKDDILPIICCWTLPNKRSDYYNVIDDIYNITGIKVRTITVMSLAVYYWTGQKVDFETDNLFLHKENYSIPFIKSHSSSVNIESAQYAGFFSPIK